MLVEKCLKYYSWSGVIWQSMFWHSSPVFEERGYEGQRWGVCPCSYTFFSLLPLAPPWWHPTSRALSLLEPAPGRGWGQLSVQWVDWPGVGSPGPYSDWSEGRPWGYDWTSQGQGTQRWSDWPGADPWGHGWLTKVQAHRQWSGLSRMGSSACGLIGWGRVTSTQTLPGSFKQQRLMC